MSLIGKKIIITGADFTDIAVEGQETKTLQSIAITTNPIKVAYGVGEQLNLNGLVVTATLKGNTSGTTSTVVVANYTTSPANGAILSTAGTTAITVSYTYRGVTKTASFNVTVRQLTVYTIAATVTNGTYSGDTSIAEESTASITISPSSGYVLPDSITVSGATYVYAKSTGLITLSNPTGDVTITATCPVQPEETWVDITSTLTFQNSTCGLAFASQDAPTSWSNFLSSNISQKTQTSTASYFRYAEINAATYIGKQIRFVFPKFKNAAGKSGTGSLKFLNASNAPVEPITPANSGTKWQAMIFEDFDSLPKPTFAYETVVLTVPSGTSKIGYTIYKPYGSESPAASSTTQNVCQLPDVLFEVKQ